MANFDAAFYKLYVVDPSEQNIMVFDPSSDGSGYHSAGTGRLPTDRPVDGITDLMIDGDIFVAENGAGGAGDPGRRAGRRELPDDTPAPARPATTRCSRRRSCANGNPSRRIGALYAFDATNHRVVAFNKSDGKYLGQYQLTGDDDEWSDLQGLDVLPTAGGGRAVHDVVDLEQGPQQRAARGGRAGDAGRVARARPRPRRPGDAPKPTKQAASTDGAAVVGDPAPRREPDPADPGGHAVR